MYEKCETGAQNPSHVGFWPCLLSHILQFICFKLPFTESI